MPTTMKVLLAYDGSAFAHAAVDDLARAGIPRDGEVVVLAVADIWAPPAASSGERLTSKLTDMIQARNEELRELATQAVEAARGDAEEAAQRLQKMGPGWRVRVEAVNGLPAWEIIKYADRWRPDLIVIGSRGRTAVERVLLGSVSQKVLAESGCSVRIARAQPGGAGADTVLRVLIAVDGSSDANAAVAAMAARDWPTDTAFRLIASDDPFGPSGKSHPDWNLQAMRTEGSEETRTWIENTLSAPARTLRAAGLEVSENVGWGDAAHVILREAESWKADCIVLGARGHGLWHRLLLGSVSAAVAMRASCSVEVIRPAATS